MRVAKNVLPSYLRKKGGSCEKDPKYANFLKSSEDVRKAKRNCESLNIVG